MLRDFRASLKLPRAVLVAALATIGPAMPIRAQPPREGCLARHYATYARAQRDYQRTVERLAATDTSLRALAALVRADQVARIDARQRAVETLLRTSPGSVRVDRAANQWLDWGPTEAARLARIDTVYARLDSAARASGRSLSSHPQWGALRDAVRGRVQAEPEHRTALDRLIAAMNAKPDCGD